MGLDFSPCETHWGYIGFNWFRVKLAAEAGIALNCMQGFAGGPTGKSFDSLSLFGKTDEAGQLPGYDKYVGNQPVIAWDKVKDDIAPLLNHSNCDGILTPEECRKVAPRLRELVKEWPDDDRDKINALLLAEGMELAAKNNENLEFC